MKFSIAAITFGLVSLAAAAPQRPAFAYNPAAGNPYGPGGYTPPQAQKVTCLTSDTANSLISGFSKLLTNYDNKTADALLASDFTDTSDSINIIAGYPLGSVTFPSKAAFKAGQGSQPPIGFTVLSVDEIDCTKVGFRWEAVPNLALPNMKVKGINSFVASNLNGTAQGWQLKTMYSEFNSCQWVLAYGGKCGFQ